MIKYNPLRLLKSDLNTHKKTVFVTNYEQVDYVFQRICAINWSMWIKVYLCKEKKNIVQTYSQRSTAFILGKTYTIKQWFNSKQSNMEYWKKLRIIKRCQEVCNFSHIFIFSWFLVWNWSIASECVWCPSLKVCLVWIWKNPGKLNKIKSQYNSATVEKPSRFFGRVDSVTQIRDTNICFHYFRSSQTECINIWLEIFTVKHSTQY